jgi:putative membrane protein
MRFLPAASILALLIAPPALGQAGNPAAPGPGIGNPAGTAPGTREQAPGAPAPHQANQADRAFAMAAAMGGVAEVDLAKLAEQNSQSDAVKALARRMVQDHSKANQELSQVTGRERIPITPQIDAEHKQAREGLAALRGPQFDVEYLRLQLQDHQRTAQLLEYEIGSGEDAALQGFASQTLPIVLQHLQMVQALMTELARENPQVTAAPPKVSGMPTPQTPNAPKN